MVIVKFKSGKLPTNIADRLKYLYRLQEKLRVYHNAYGKKYRDGIITLEELREFQITWFDPRNLLLCRKINGCKDSLTKNASTVCSIADIEEE